MLDRIRTVLVRPIRSGNVGAACRAMMNMGLSDLVLVAPECDPDDEQAQGYAARAKPLLARARIVDSIAAALDGCVKSFATSAKGGMYRRQAGVTAAVGAELALEAAAGGRVAIAFGPEDRGLVMRELLEFDHVIEVPADPEYPVLNLAAAVTVLCYELRQQWLRMAGGVPAALNDEPLASDERKRTLYAKLFEALDEIGFFGGQQNPDHLKFALRRIFGRVDLTVNEVDILIGMTQQIRWYVEHRRRG
jgi:TrmH family RNA methyltransferase